MRIRMLNGEQVVPVLYDRDEKRLISAHHIL